MAQQNGHLDLPAEHRKQQCFLLQLMEEFNGYRL